MAFNYKNVKPWGRSYDEYVQMFDLTHELMDSNILGIGDGPASFNAIMSANKKKVISVDPIYQLTKAEIKDRIIESFEDILLQTKNNSEKFRWDKIKNLQELGEIRMTAMNTFLEDFEEGKNSGRYIYGSLPSLPFKDSSFDLILSSHLLFLYSNLLDLEFHIKSVAEMLRIANEIRIFPILDSNGGVSRHYYHLNKFFLNQGFEIQLKKVNYEFQINGNELLVISKK